ncbi:MAG TPA: S-adenosylmethionine:tRNA ribosyltransferase-isomerase, partial [Usitatibacter sp.]|nr:S-adenosylmethionine:tRNA ribosyltransferase-isomerase [Usitatibacter sp.]
MRIEDFDYDLPPGLIAQRPASERAASRLLHLDGTTGELRDRMFRDLLQLVDAKDLVVFNDTKVIKARLHGRKDTGGEVEILVERILDASRALAHIRASKPPKAGRQIHLARGGVVEVLGREGELYELLFLDGPVLDVLEAWGE